MWHGQTLLYAKFGTECEWESGYWIWDCSRLMPTNNDDQSFRDKHDGSKACQRILVLATNRIHDALDDEKLDTAILLAATHSEAVLAQRLQRYFEVHHVAFEELVGSQTLGWYLSKANEHDLVDQAYRAPLNDLVEKRNRLAHDLSYMQKLRDDEDEQAAVRDIVESCVDWLES